MWNLIWEGRFPSKTIINTTEIVEDDLPENVIPIGTPLSISDNIEREVMEYESEIIKLIDDIIDWWINDYIVHKKEENSDTYELEIRKRNLLRETTHIWKEMYIKAQWIEDAINFVWNDIQVWFDLKPEYILWAIEWLLNTYRNRVFEKLVSNGLKISSNQQ